MAPKSLLIANRGEIAIRIADAAAEIGVRTVAIFSEDDEASLHRLRADQDRPLRGVGAAAYLDVDQIIEIARHSGCDAIHPGYGFLSESAGFARRCADEGILFVGPRPEILDLFGDKARARSMAERCGVPVLAATRGPTLLAEAIDFFAAQGEGGAVMVKAIAGGGGRGMRAVHRLADLEEAITRCQSEARAAFGGGDVYVERWMPRARHIEVQVLGDRSGHVTHLWERDCTIQRRHQKLVEIAPSPAISESLRQSLTAAAVRIAESVHYDNLGTFEFLVGLDGDSAESFAFIEANPRLQVEHTVTEEITGVDLVKAQILLAGGATLAEAGVSQIASPAGFAIQLRINAESIGADGTPLPSDGVLRTFEVPSGPGVRVDSSAYAGYATNTRFDSLIAKVIVHSRSAHFADAVAKAYRALGELRIAGVATNARFLQSVLKHPDFAAARAHVGFVEVHAHELADDDAHPQRHFAAGDPPQRGRDLQPGSAAARAAEEVEGIAPEDWVVIRAPMPGTVVSIGVADGDAAAPDQALVVMEAMKMEHVIRAPAPGTVRRLSIAPGDMVREGDPLLFLERRDDVTVAGSDFADPIDLDAIRPDLAEVIQRHESTLDSARPDAVARRRKSGQRTARENVADLCDPDSFVEYGGLAVAAQRRRRTMKDLIHNTPADGLVCGHATVNADLFGPERAHCVVMAYDFTVLAGTQGHLSHRKTDKMLELARERHLPLVLFAEGGGGRPGDTDGDISSSRTFRDLARLSGLVPLIGVVSGRCFAGNASLLGCCDVIIAARDANIGMGGPAMIESGGLGVVRPEEIGPIGVQRANGVVDVAVADEAEAVRVAKKYLSYFEGSLRDWECGDQRVLRHAIPENRRRVHDVRRLIDTLADTGSVLELRSGFGRAVVTAFVRIEGRAIGLVANDPMHLAGAIDSDAADKASRFVRLCDAFDLPLVYLCDTPGIMVGPEVEKTALVRHSSRLFLAGANATVPFLTIVLRKAYGLGALALTGGSYGAATAAVAWPTGEFAPMAIEGAVKLGYRDQLAAISDPAERTAKFDEMVAAMYERSNALNQATHFVVDDVIDPADTRRWIAATLRSTPAPATRASKKHRFVDSW